MFFCFFYPWSLSHFPQTSAYAQTCIALSSSQCHPPTTATQNPALLPRWNPGGRWVPCQFPLQPFFAAVRSYPSVSNKPYERNLQIQDFNGASKHKKKLHVPLKQIWRQSMSQTILLLLYPPFPLSYAFFLAGCSYLIRYQCRGAVWQQFT